MRNLNNEVPPNVWYTDTKRVKVKISRVSACTEYVSVLHPIASAFCPGGVQITEKDSFIAPRVGTSRADL